MSVRDDLTKLQARVAGIVRERDEARGLAAASDARARAFARAADTEKAEAHTWRLRCKELEAALAGLLRQPDAEARINAQTILAKGPRA